MRFPKTNAAELLTGGIPMRLARAESGRLGVRLKERVVTQHRPQHIDLAPSERQHRLVMPLALGPLPVVVGSASRLLQAGECGLEEHALEGMVTGSRADEPALGLA